MATETNVTEVLIDSAIGPLRVRQAKVTGYDVDDYVSSMVDSQATYLRMLTLIDNTDPLQAANRPPVRLGGEQVGGY